MLEVWHTAMALPKEKEKKMTSPKTKKAASSTKNSPVTSPAITKAWGTIVEVSKRGEEATIEATLELGRQMVKSTLSIRDIQKAIKATGLESPFVKVSHVEGLPTMLEMQKVPGFAALPLSKQLSTATASYKLLGAGNGEQLSSLEAIEKANAGARKVKNDKPKATTTPKTPKDTLKSILAFFTALNTDILSDDEKDTLCEIESTIGNLMANA